MHLTPSGKFRVSCLLDHKISNVRRANTLFAQSKKTEHKIFVVHSKCEAFDNKFAKQTCSRELRTWTQLHTALAVYCQRGDVRNDFVRHFGFIIVKTRAANSEFATRGGVCKNRSANYLRELFCSSLRNIPSECSCSINEAKS